MKCAKCTHSRCYTQGQNCTKITGEEVEKAYTEDSFNLKIMQAAACTEGRFYNNLTRLEESVEFAKLLGVKKIGIAFCIGLKQEAGLIQDYLGKFFEVESVCCKICGTPKSELGLEQIKEGSRETMCNPLMQAEILNRATTEINFTVGLCVGHDMLFSKGSAAPVSCLVAKDRVLAHNPVGVVYSRYWRRKLGINPEGQV